MNLVNKIVTLAAVMVMCGTGFGCKESTQPPKGSDKIPTAETGTTDKPAADSGKSDDTVVADAVVQPEGTAELKLDGIEFLVPSSWKKVKPQTNIVEAEFELPRAEGDEYDGRLTLMSSGGNPDEVVGNRIAEFIREEGEQPKIETMKIAGTEAKWVDLRGEWKGPAFRPIEPRKDYRMLFVIIPFTERAAFYAKLTGPRETIAAREEEFRDFIKTARITLKLPAPETP